MVHKHKKSYSMFSRLMALFLAIIILIVTGLLFMFSLSIRDNLVDMRMNELISAAKEMAYLAGQQYATRINMQYPIVSIEAYKEQMVRNEVINETLQWKSQRLLEEFGAYVFIENITGSYVRVTSLDAYVSFKDLDVHKSIKYRVLKGEEVSYQLPMPGSVGNTAFVVGVPWTYEEPSNQSNSQSITQDDQDNQTISQSRAITGSVIIYTSVQQIEAGYEQLVFQVMLGAGGAILLAILLVLVFTKQVTRPLKTMAQSAANMAIGRFDQKAEVIGVSEVQELAIAFNAMQDQLSQLENTRREFVANVSHELRSPMTSIHGFVQGMLDGTIPPEEHSKYLKIVNDETTRLTKLIGDLLNLSRMEQGENKIKLTDFDINEMIRRVLIRRMNDIDIKNIQMDVDFASDPCYALGDSDRIEQVIINILDNAIKFTPENGHIAIHTKIINKLIHVTISDDGQGILPEDAPHIFDRFYKADKAHTSGKGTGLGLSICKRIIEDHHQSIWCEPSNQGAIFEFTLAMGKKPVREKGELGMGEG